MPLGINRTDLNDDGTTYKDGFPVTLPHDFGDPITLPHSFGNPVPTSGTEKNTVSWSPNPNHFGNTFTPATPTAFVTLNSVTATYGPDADTAALSAPDATFTISWEIPSPPVLSSSTPGSDWQTDGVIIHFVSADLGVDVILNTLSFADYFNASQSGGVDISGEYPAGSGDIYAWEFFQTATGSNQMYSGTEAAPTLTNGVYTFDNGATSAPGGDNQLLATPYNATLTSVPLATNTFSSVYGGDTPTTALTSAGATFSITFTDPSFIVPTSFLADDNFVTSVNIHYVSGAIDLTMAGTAKYYNVATGVGGVDIELHHLGVDYLWSVFRDTNIVAFYSGGESTPTLVNNVYSMDDGNQSIDGGGGNEFSGIPYNYTITT
jgi:hypothetical protein